MDALLTYYRRCHVCGERFLAAFAVPMDEGLESLSCCPPCGRAEYDPGPDPEPVDSEESDS